MFNVISYYTLVHVVCVMGKARAHARSIEIEVIKLKIEKRSYKIGKI